MIVLQVILSLKCFTRMRKLYVISDCINLYSTCNLPPTIPDDIFFTNCVIFFMHYYRFFFQEIDGKAFLLLNSDMMMKYMGLKLGPALKICHLVSRLKGRRHTH